MFNKLKYWSPYIPILGFFLTIYFGAVKGDTLCIMDDFNHYGVTIGIQAGSFLILFLMSI